MEGVRSWHGGSNGNDLTNVGPSSSTMDTFFTNRYYRINRTLLSIAGIWPCDDPKKSQLRRIVVYTGFTLVFLTQILWLVTSDLSLKSIIEVLASLMPSMCIFTSYISSYKSGKVEIMLEHVRFDWYNFNDGVERGIIEHYANRNRMCMIGSIVLFLISVSSYVLPMTMMYLLDIFMPLNETRMTELPLKVELFLDHQKHFLLYLILTYAVSFVVIITAMSSYPLFIIYTLHACAMLDVVGYMLKHMFDTEKYNLYTTKDDENFMTRMIRCVFFHARTTRYVCAINSAYSLAIIIHMFLIVIIASLSFIRVFYLENIGENMLQAFMVVSYVINTFFWMFLHSYIGQMMLNKSKDILDNVYDASWYLAPYKMQKLLLMIMMKGTRYSSLTIGGIFAVSLNFFASMTHNAMSYAMVMHSLR